MGAGTALAQTAGSPRKRQSSQAPLRVTADLPRMWECVHSYDPLLERQEPCGICVPWVSPEWKILLLLPPYPRGGTGCRGAGVCSNCAGAVRRGSKEAGTAVKNVGVAETDPRRPHFVVTGEYAETGVGN